MKEDILSRFGELGVYINEGKLGFQPILLQQNEFLQTQKKVCIVDSNGGEIIIELDTNSLLFTICQVPVVYEIRESKGMSVKYKSGEERNAADTSLTEQETTLLFNRSGEIVSIRVFIQPAMLLS